MTAMVFKIDGDRVNDCLLEACAKVIRGKGETVLDFSAVRRVDAKAIRAMEELANLADARAIKIELRGVNVEVYKVLKLVRLAPRFGFEGGKHGARAIEEESCHESATAR